MLLLASIILIVLGAYLTLYAAYVLPLLIVQVLIPKKQVPACEPRTAFTVIIPAHNEEMLLPRLLESVSRQRYPCELFTTIVVADNCTDRTTEAGRSVGVRVLERVDNERRGKGFAIQWALRDVDLSHTDAVLIIDADSVLGQEALQHLDCMIQHGDRIIQCYNGVANPDDSWFTRLLDVSRSFGNEVYHPAKRRLGLSSYLMGNGMCITAPVLRDHGWDSFTVGEDWEYYGKVVERGEVVAFASDARVYHRESSSLGQATTQRMRWSSGRFAIAWKYGLRLLRKGLVQGDLVKIDAALPLIFPNPSLGLNIAILCLAITVTVPIEHSHVFTVWFLTLAVVQSALFSVGVLYTRNRVSKFASIFVAPIFLAWKLVIDVLSLFGAGRKRWIRTERKL